MTTDKPARTLKLTPGAAQKKPADPFAPRRAPVRPPGPARAKSVSASAPKPPREAPQGRGAPRGGPEGERGRSERPAPRRADDRFAAPDRPQRSPSAVPRPPQPHRPDLARVGNVRGEIRLNKRMADLGLCSRREADEWIARGWVLVNGEPAVMGMPVAPDAQVEVLPQARHQQAGQVTILLNKPVGYVSGQPEDGHEAAATLIGAPSQWRGDAKTPADGRRFAPEHTRGLAPAGRLDIDSTGLLVLTQDGRVARTLIGESSGVEKEYLVRVQFAPNGPMGAGVIAENVQAVFPPHQLARLRHGLSLDEQALKPAQVDWQNPEQLRFVLVEGKKRQIRRMCEQVGLHVVGLKRVRIGQVVLGNLPVGQWRYLRADEAF
ncbi:MAG: pseudouridine synthase [Hydrogenophaga sp.]|uniref:pseudouridine synthase n=1 Tax=Hydrogenophaga sp. TaxID=1904254 RepID=UPI00260ACE0C|nr:pseudouridine synthase [Hydrogenophaga sp.]MDM7943905.1 pseudouridine synthase [Hydrogenophaga sp.]